MILKNKNILMVEDDLVFAQTQQFLFNKYDIIVTHKTSGNEAIEFLSKNKKIDLILMDIFLDDQLDGVKTAELILENYDIPIIFFSSYSEEEIVAKTENVASYGYLTKNTSETVKMAVIKMALQISETKKELNKELQLNRKKNKVLENAISSLNSLFDNARIPTLIWNKNRKIVKFNNSFELLTGISREEIIGKDITLIFPENQRDNYYQLIMNTLNDSQNNIELEIFDEKSNSSKIVQWTSSSFFDKSPDYNKYFIAQCINITLQKQNQESLESVINNQSALLNACPDLIFIYDSEYHILDAHPSCKTYQHYKSPDESIGKAINDVLPTEVAKKFTNCIDLVIKHGKLIEETYELEINNEIMYFDIRFVLLGKDKVLSIAKNITKLKHEELEREKIQKQFVHAQKMESIGRLASGVAHDFNNMLGIIIGYSDIITMDLDPQHQFYKYVKEIENAAKKSAGITRQLLTFSRKQIVQPVVVDLNIAIKETYKMLNRLIGEDIKLEFESSLETAKIKIDPSQVDQILANLCVNARDAISDTGKINIEISKSTLPKSILSINPHLNDKNYVLLSVTDNGHGMSPETQEKLFEPFFTTKKVGEGTGLGLSTVYGIVQQNNGFIKVVSELGKGSSFKIYLPEIEEQTEDDNHKKKENQNLTGKESILILEDEEHLLKMTIKILSKHGYVVVGLNSSVDALEFLKKENTKFDLIISDVVMPEMNGKEFLSSVREFMPNIKCLFMSGYTANVIEKYGILNKDYNFIQKPFSISELTQKVRNLLDEKD